MAPNVSFLLLWDLKKLKKKYFGAQCGSHFFMQTSKQILNGAQRGLPIVMRFEKNQKNFGAQRGSHYFMQISKQIPNDISSLNNFFLFYNNY